MASLVIRTVYLSRTKNNLKKILTDETAVIELTVSSAKINLQTHVNNYC